MADDDKDQQLDALLDSILSAYSAAEPRPGLEIRIRARLRAHAQQQRKWMLIAAASAAVVVLVVAMTRASRLGPSVAGDLAASRNSAGLGAGIQATPLEPSVKPAYRRANHRASARNEASSQIVLQLANALPRADNVIFERERLYLSPEPQQAAEPAPEPQTSAPRINIQDLGVQAIEIKDLPSVKSPDPKGSL